MNRCSGAALAVAIGVMLTPLACPSAARADDAPIGESPDVGSPEAIEAARAHYAKGRALYQAGAYREAIAEFEAARALDPKAKELVFNLAVIHEKLGNMDDALRFVHLYAQMDLDAGERARAEGYITRLEGAKHELDGHKAPEAKPPASAGGEAGHAPPRVRGRLDVATFAAGGGALAFAVVGTVLGVKALADRPTSFVTGRDGTVAQLQHLEHTAHTEAVAADVCFIAAIAAAAGAGYLYFGRYRDSAPARASWLTVTPVVTPSAGTLVLGGAF
jgi:tetratricopeptide (TPR) repeat protein